MLGLLFSQYLVYFLSLIYYRYIFSRQFHYYYLSRHSSIKNLPSLSIKFTLFYMSNRYHLCIYLVFLYLRFFSAQYILIGYFLYFIFSNVFHHRVSDITECPIISLASTIYLYTTIS